MVSGPVDPEFIRLAAEQEGFALEVFEKAYRLAQLLCAIGDHPWLAPRVVLKGGTCINFFHAPLPRLSVDMDINYIGAVDKERMLAEKPELMRVLRDLAKDQGYTPEDVRHAYAGWTVRFVHESVTGQRASVRADVNFLMRVPLYGAEPRVLPDLFELPRTPIPCLSAEEVYGSKLKALAVRGEPRDVFDAAELFLRGPNVDAARLRKAFLFYAHMDDATLRTVDLAAVEALDERACRERLHPMLRRGRRPSPQELKALVLPRLKEMLALTGSEQEFGRRLEAQQYEPGLLFEKVAVNPDIARHPAAEWRRQKPHGRLPVTEGEPGG